MIRISLDMCLTANILIFMYNLAVMSGNYILPQARDFSELAESYIEVNYDPTNHPSYMGVACVWTTQSIDVADWFAGKNVIPHYTVSNLSYEELPESKPNSYFFLAGSLKELVDIYDRLSNSSLWDPRGYFTSIVCEDVLSAQQLTVAMHEISKKRTLDSLIIFPFEGIIQAFSYKYYVGEEIMNYTGYKDKLEYVYAHKYYNVSSRGLRVAIFQEVPSTFFMFGFGWGGIDVNVAMNLAKSLNGKIQWVEVSEDASNEKLLAKDVDFCAVSRFMSTDMSNQTVNYEFAYPLEPDSLFLLLPVPKEIPKYMNMLLIFEKIVWLSLLCLILLLTLTWKVFFKVAAEEIHLSISECFLQILSCLFALPIMSRFLVCKSSIRIIMINWMLASLIVIASFQCCLVSFLITPKFYRKLETVSEFRESGILVYATHYETQRLSPSLDIEKQLIVVSKKKREDLVYNRDLTKGYIINSRIAATYQGQSQFDFDFYILKEPLVSGYKSYVFQRRSPYLKRVNDLLLLQHQFGFWIMINFRPYSNITENSKTLTLDHLQTAFYLWIGGNIIALMAFIVEAFPRNVKLKSKL